jgi:hypothetical protein
MMMSTVYGHANRERRKIAGAAGDGSAEHHSEQEKGEQSLDGKAGRWRDGDGRYRAERQVVCERGRAETGRHAAQHGRQCQHGGDGADELGDNVTGRVHGAHGTRSQHAQGDGRIHMTSGNGCHKQKRRP